jgi:3-isopropylmalate/(R)-2-methylmalate dehydratase small subunit
MLAKSAGDADMQVEVDLSAQTMSMPASEIISFDIDAFSKRCLLEGMDQLEYILSFEEAIATHEEGNAK